MQDSLLFFIAKDKKVQISTQIMIMYAVGVGRISVLLFSEKITKYACRKLKKATLKGSSF